MSEHDVPTITSVHLVNKDEQLVRELRNLDQQKGRETHKVRNTPNCIKLKLLIINVSLIFKDRRHLLGREDEGTISRD